MEQADELSRIGGNREAAFVAQACAGDGGAVNFRSEKRNCIDD